MRIKLVTIIPQVRYVYRKLIISLLDTDGVARPFYYGFLN